MFAMIEACSLSLFQWSLLWWDLKWSVNRNLCLFCDSLNPEDQSLINRKKFFCCSLMGHYSFLLLYQTFCSFCAKLWLHGLNLLQGISCSLARSYRGEMILIFRMSSMSSEMRRFLVLIMWTLVSLILKFEGWSIRCLDGLWRFAAA